MQHFHQKNRVLVNETVNLLLTLKSICYAEFFGCSLGEAPEVVHIYIHQKVSVL